MVSVWLVDIHWREIRTNKRCGLDGARVIKVERPGEGDFARYYDKNANGKLSSYFAWLNRGKLSVTADFKGNKEDYERVLAMIAGADVFVQNLAPGAADRAGLGSRYLRSLFPKLITLDIAGYPEHSAARRGYKAYDLLIAAETGLCSVTGSKEEPGRVGISICDIAAGMNGHSAVYVSSFFSCKKSSISFYSLE
jgi:itaconate CoA-transferase